MSRGFRIIPFLAVLLFCFASDAGALPGPVYSGPGSVPAVALTFDDGPHQFTTPRLIEILDELSVKGTFFIVGTQAVKFPDILEDLVSRGHTVANHSWSHRNITQLDHETLFEEIVYCSQAIEAITGVRPRFFRPPGGKWDSQALAVVQELGLTTVLWDVSGRDMVRRSPDGIAASVVKAARPGSVILLHGGMEWTMEALPLIVKGLREKGFLLASLDQMFPFAGVAKVPLRNALAVHPEKVLPSK
jgi:peptidoglycan/xylan/chitin deacetylase (PgdA/CDA1 family)